MVLFLLSLKPLTTFYVFKFLLRSTESQKHKGLMGIYFTMGVIYFRHSVLLLVSIGPIYFQEFCALRPMQIDHFSVILFRGYFIVFFYFILSVIISSFFFLLAQEHHHDQKLQQSLQKCLCLHV